MDMKRLFERMADEYDGTCEASVVRPEYARLTFLGNHGEHRTTVELFMAIAVDPTGTKVPLVRVQSEGKAVPVLVSPVPSAVIAVALR